MSWQKITNFKKLLSRKPRFQALDNENRIDSLLVVVISASVEVGAVGRGVLVVVVFVVISVVADKK